MAIFPGSAIPSAVSDYEIDNSLRFEDADNPVLYLDTFGSPTNAKKFTISFWTKRGNLSTTQRLMGAKINGTNSAGHFFFHTDDELQWYFLTSGDTEYRIDTKAVFRDPSAWYHVLLSYDSTNVTAADRMQIHVNGTRQEVDKGGNGDPPTDTLACFNENNSIYAIGSTIANASTPTFEYPYDGYLAEFYFIDGTQLAPSSFGELSSTTNQWIPLDSDDVKDAVTFGTNGFFQKYNSTELANSFADSSPLTSPTITFVPTESITADILVVAGGGGGGGLQGGGGGAGGMQALTGQSLTAITYDIGVGSGGEGGANTGATADKQGKNGFDSFISGADITTITSTGGGGGATEGQDGSDGGSGGGTSYSNGTTPGSGVSGQGYAGGDGYSAASNWPTGGGGGAGEVGGGATSGSDPGGDGGDGLQNAYRTGVNTYYAGGGGGNGYNTGNDGSGGSGGGGAGVSGSPGGDGQGIDGTSNTGGGGGGGGAESGLGGDGGSGIIVIRYLASSAKASGGTITTYGSGGSQYYVHSFTTTNVRDIHTITANGDVKNVRGANLDTTYSVIDAFTSTGADTWTCPTGVTSIELLSVAGGGGGAYRYYGGGGGAGGIIHDTSYTVVPGVVYDLSVGAGGAAGAAAGEGADGSDTVWNVNAEGSGITFTADGGGGGSGTGNGNPGGSGGGAKGSEGSSYTGGAATQTSPTGATGYGYAGGNEIDWGGAGGGGSSEVGGSPDTPTGKGGDGGDGRLFSTFVAYGTDSSNVASTGSNGGYFGGGGGGGAYPDSSSSIGGVGGIGGGGKGAKDEGGAVNAVAGTANTGGGGGAGAWGGGGTANGKAGGSGILLIAYELPKPGSSSIEFDGTGDYLTIPNSSDFDFGTNSFTLEGWVRLDSTATSDQVFIANYQDDNNRWVFGFDGSGSSSDGPYFYSVIASTSTSPVIEQGSLTGWSADTWTHVALVRDGNDWEIFRDGTSVATATSSITLADMSGDNLSIGAREYSSSYGGLYSGYMDEIRISNSARYTAAFTPSTTQFTADSNTKLLIHSDWTGGLGADSSGNYNNFTATNLVATDQMIDTPTNNWCTLNPLLGTAAELAEGNLLFDPDTSPDTTKSSSGTIGATSGKWYYEFYIHDVTNNGPIGARDDAGLWDETGGPPGYCEYAAESGGSIYLDGLSTISSVGAFVATDIIGVAVNMDDGEIQWFKNGAVLSGSGNVPVTMPATTAAGFVPYVRAYSPDKYCANFGQDSSFAGTVTAQGNQDGNEKGDFYYAPPSGFLALCSNNLSAPEIALPGENFNTVLYTGNDTADRDITGVGFQPDFLWIKKRSASGAHNLFDSIRGPGSVLESNDTSAEDDTGDRLNSFDADGFDISGNSNVNEDTKTFVAWNWKGGGAAVSNTDGTDITSSVSANTTAGFSIVKWTGTGSVDDSVGHGLSQKPELIIVKKILESGEWATWHDSFPVQSVIYLDSTGAAYITGESGRFDTLPTASVFTPGNAANTNENTKDYISYCFHSVEGYSKVGIYEGNDDADGPFVYTGFSPKFLLFKNIDRAGQAWPMYDDVMHPNNPLGDKLLANSNVAENANTNNIDFVSNGFKLRDNSYVNNYTDTYIYIAFAESPFKYSNAR